MSNGNALYGDEMNICRLMLSTVTFYPGFPPCSLYSTQCRYSVAFHVPHLSIGVACAASRLNNELQMTRWFISHTIMIAVHDSVTEDTAYKCLKQVHIVR